MLFTVNLASPLTYKAEDNDFSSIHSRPAGSELCYCYRFYYENDALFALEKLWSGSRTPLSDEEKNVIESGLPALPRPGYDRTVAPGRYRMLQTVPAEDEAMLRKAAFCAAADKREGLMYVRFFKENEFETVMQIFIPL